MARKIKFALEMADGTFVSNLEDLQKHIKNNDDVKKLIEYFLDGRLEKWLLDRYYEEEAKKLKSINKDDPDFTCKLCKAIGVDYTPNESVNIDLIEYEKKMRKALEEVTSDSELIANAGCTASTQSDLDFLIKNGKKIIYLWGDSFKLPLLNDMSYIGILSKPLVDIDLVDLNVLKSYYGIKFENLNLPEKFNPNPFKNANVGDIVKFGNYPQTANGDVSFSRKGFRSILGGITERIPAPLDVPQPYREQPILGITETKQETKKLRENNEFQPIEWQVLAIKNNKMLVSSKYGIDCKRFDGSSNNWCNSEIRNWLNGDFYNKAFNEKERKYIKSSNLSDVGTTDNVFLLSFDEANKYFANDESRRCKATEYAVKNGAWVADSSCGDNAGYSYWWLRSPISNDCNFVCTVHNDGNIYGNYVGKYYVVRPALWINL